MLNKLQKAGFELIQSDARFIYTFVDIFETEKNIDSNYMLMCLPYIGVFADGAEQWCKKVGLDAPRFNDEEKEFYVKLRQAHKLYELTYKDYEKLLLEKFHESNEYFYNNRSLLEKVIGYYNVGADYCNGVVCGNTILCAMYNPFNSFQEEVGPKIQDLSVITGKLVGYICDMELAPFKYDDINNVVTYKDYHFYKNCPIKLKSDLGFVLFSVLCSINYITEFIEKYIIEEIPQKFKLAYLQYYYLCDFIDGMNRENHTNFTIDKKLKNRDLRNCFAHYGLGQYMRESEIDNNDLLKGLTKKAFGLDYYSCKKELYGILDNLKKQIEEKIF